MLVTLKQFPISPAIIGPASTLLIFPQDAANAAAELASEMYWLVVVG